MRNFLFNAAALLIVASQLDTGSIWLLIAALLLATNFIFSIFKLPTKN